MRFFRSTLAALAVFAAGGVAPADAQTYYVAVRGGYAYAHDDNLKLGGAGGLDTEFEAGYAAAASFGFESVDHWRLEGEFSWRRNALDLVDGGAASGDIQAYALMANVFYGIDTGTAITPYLGGGGGAARVAVADAAAAGQPAAGGFDTVLAWQVAAGVEVNVSASLILTIEYRFFAADDVAFRDSRGNGFAADYRTSTGLAGLRFQF